MAGVAFITGKKTVNDTQVDVFYIGTVESDGYTYFNDDHKYRYRTGDTSVIQLFYYPKQIWIQTNTIQDVNSLEFDVSAVLNAISGLLGGAGAANPNASVEAAVQWLVKKATTQYITYSQSNRNLNNPNGTSYDCSSFVITGFNEAGFNIQASYTGDMRAGFTAKGFKWIPGSNFPASQCIRGDILLNETRHTQVYIGDNKDVNCGSTPARVVTHSPNYWGTGWSGLLRYTGGNN